MKNLFHRIKKTVENFRKGPTTQDLTKRMVFSVTKKRAFPSWTQWKHLPRAFTLTERRVSVIALSAIVVSVLFLGGRYITLHATLVPTPGGEYVEALIGTPQFVNPLYANRSDADRDLTKLIYSGLMKQGNEGLTTDLAESYDVSDDGKTYTFVLREHVRWHDGEPVTVTDVISTFAMLQNPEYRSPLYPTFREVDVTQVDDRTVQFTLTEPFAPFLSTLTVGIMPAHVWEFVPPKNATLAEANLQPIGSGPYKFEKFSKDKMGNVHSYTLVRNDQFYAKEPNVERLIFRFYPDSISAMDALVKKNVDGVSFIPTDRVDDFENDRDVTLWRPSIPQYTALFFNEVHAEVLKEKKVRQALSMAIEKERLVAEVLPNSARVVNAPVLPGMVGYDESIKGPSFDVDGARALLDEAGKTLKEGETIRFSLTLTTIDHPEFIAAAEFIQQAWGLIGVETTLNVVSSPSLQSEVLRERSYDILLSGEFLANGDPDLYPFWHSSQSDYPGLNIALYQNRKVDTLIEEARTAIDTETRGAKYRELQALLIEDLPALFLYQPTYTYALSSDVQGADIQSITDPSDRFAGVVDWYLETAYVLK